MSQNGRDSLAATPNGKLSPPRYPVNSAAAARAFGFEATEEDLDIDDKVEELMRSVWETFYSLPFVSLWLGLVEVDSVLMVNRVW